MQCPERQVVGQAQVPQVIKFSASIMTLGVIGRKGIVMPLFFLDSKERVEATRYC